MKSVVQIAIDGPVGSGKTDISIRLAQTLGFVFIYTGAMYRALAYLCEKYKVPYSDTVRIVSLLDQHILELLAPVSSSGRPYRVVVDDEDITKKLFTPSIDIGASNVAVIPEVRKRMVSVQQYMARGKSVIMEGRDIGLRVLPNADLKIYLTADVETRARRRYEQYIKAGKTMAMDELIEDTKKRDLQDTSRLVDPLQKLSDAWELDTTSLSQKQVIQKIIDELKNRKLI